MNDNEPTATLIISRTYSKCGGCGQETLPRTATHENVSGFGGGQPGCGARFVAVTSDQASRAAGRAWCAGMRPDLPWVDYADRDRPKARQDAGTEVDQAFADLERLEIRRDAVRRIAASITQQVDTEGDET